MEEMAAGAHEMLPRIRHRPLQLSLVSALTRSLGCSGRHRPSPTKGHGLRPAPSLHVAGTVTLRAIRFLSRPTKPMALSPLAKSGRAAGSGV
jgi:hypothetical protein